MTLQRIFLAFCTCCSFFMASYAQTARQVLDETANKINASGGIEAAFEATQFNGTVEAGTTNGNLYIDGNKFKLSSSSLTMWFDGHTQWTLLTGSNEVNVSTPTKAELQQINPYTFINLYKSGYDLRLANTNHKGKILHEVRLIAQSKSNTIQLLIVVIDKTTHFPVSIRLKDNRGEWKRIRVNNIRTNRKYNDSAFRFNQKQYPNVEVIDLR